MKLTLLIVEDDEGLRGSLAKSLRRRSHLVLESSTVSDAKRLLRARKIDLVLLDLRLANGSGFEVLEAARELDEEISVVVMTAYPEVKSAVRAMKAGARDFVVKPFELEDLHFTLERTIETRALRRRVQRLEHERQNRGEFAAILGESPVVERLRLQIAKVALADSPVLVVGETGTGKELVADAIHSASPRLAGPLVKTNCSAFSEQLLESELFGHEKGAFTDARQARAGLFEMADGGTLFFDEISEMKPELQAELLRVVEGQPFRRVGGQREIHTSVRVVAATNRDLRGRVQTGRFREDLYFRLKVFQLDVPPLRQRGKVAMLLARFFLHQSAAALRKGPLLLTPQAEEILLAYDWPGNVRELRNVMERAAILCETEEVSAQHLPVELQASGFVRSRAEVHRAEMPSLSDIERSYARHVVQRAGGNLSEAARILGIARNTLRAKLADPGMAVGEVPGDGAEP